VPEQQLQPGCRYRPRRACYEDRAGAFRRASAATDSPGADVGDHAGKGSSMSVPRIREQPIGCWLLVSAGEMANHYAYRRNRRNIVQITRSPDADRPPSVLGEEASPQRTLRPVDGSAAEGSVVMSHAKRIKDAADNARPGPGTGEQSRRGTLPRAAAFWIVAGLFLILFFASPAASLLYGGIPGPVHFPAAALAGRQFAVG
jgi:hypothetical protein